ncbi:MAG: hypothetical protein RI967_1333 [Planctomycetota bacterium]|jgi:hypothetical protein
MEREADRPTPLDTSRPWLSIAGCLGGGVVLAVFGVLLVAAIVALVLLRGCGGGGPPIEIELESALGRLREAPALKVATREISVRVEVERPNVANLRLWPDSFGGGWPVEIGRTRATVVAPSNRVQYIVPLDRQAPVATVWADDGLRRTVVVTLPAPRVDEELVEVESDPRAVRVEVDRDWADHLVGDGSARDLALARVREAVLEEASSDTALFEVREKARATVEGMIRALLPPAWSAHDIRIRWDDEPDDSTPRPLP